MGNVSKIACKRFWMGQKVIWMKIHWICRGLHKNYDENSDMGFFLVVNVEYSKNLLNLYMDLSFLPERNKIKKM